MIYTTDDYIAVCEFLRTLNQLNLISATLNVTTYLKLLDKLRGA